MKNLFKIGDKKSSLVVVDESRLARFEADLVHPVYATFAIAKDAEWVCRLFVLEMTEKGEEGIGAFVSVKHHAPAPVGASVKLEASLISIVNNKIHCEWVAFWGETLIAQGEQTQYIIDTESFTRKLTELKTRL